MATVLVATLATGFIAGGARLPLASYTFRSTGMSKVALNGGKGFGGGEATRDPEPTYVDPNDPKGKQQARAGEGRQRTNYQGMHRACMG